MNKTIAINETEQEENIILDPKEFEQEQQELEHEPEYKHLLKLAVELGIEI